MAKTTTTTNEKAQDSIHATLAQGFIRMQIDGEEHRVPFPDWFPRDLGQGTCEEFIERIGAREVTYKALCELRTNLRAAYRTELLKDGGTAGSAEEAAMGYEPSVPMDAEERKREAMKAEFARLVETYGKAEALKMIGIG